MKKHIKVNGQLINKNKRFQDLKQSQKEFIYELIKIKYNEFVKKENKFPTKKDKEIILNAVYEKIEDENIWIPFNEIKKFYESKLFQLNKSQQIK